MEFELSIIKWAQQIRSRKGPTYSCIFLGGCLISWNSKKQNSIALSTAEAEYVASETCVAQILWIKNQLKDYGISLKKIRVMCDNTSAINLAKNPIVHSHTKHIDIQHHFIRDLINKEDINFNLPLLSQLQFIRHT